MQAFVAGHAVADLGFIQQVQRGDQVSGAHPPAHLPVAVFQVGAYFHEVQHLLFLAHQQVAEEFGPAPEEVVAFEALLQDFVEDQQRAGHILRQHGVHHLEEIVIVEYVQVLEGVLVSQLAPGKAHDFVKRTEGVAHAPVGFLRNEVQGVAFRGHVLFGHNFLQVVYRVLYGDAFEIEYLATAQDGGQYLVLFRGGQDEDGIGGRLFQRFSGMR